jgi:hypothetical protein
MLGIVDSQMVGDYKLDQGMSALEVLDKHLDEGSTVHWGWMFDPVELLDKPVRLGGVLLLLLYWLAWLVF